MATSEDNNLAIDKRDHRRSGEQDTGDCDTSRSSSKAGSDLTTIEHDGSPSLTLTTPTGRVLSLS